MCLSICLLAAGLVKQIQAGCDLYKQAKESFMEVKSTVDEAVGVYREVTGFWNNFSNFFKPKAKQSTPKSALNNLLTLTGAVRWFRLKRAAEAGSSQGRNQGQRFN